MPGTRLHRTARWKAGQTWRATQGHAICAWCVGKFWLRRECPCSATPHVYQRTLPRVVCASCAQERRRERVREPLGLDQSLFNQSPLSSGDPKAQTFLGFAFGIVLFFWICQREDVLLSIADIRECTNFLLPSSSVRASSPVFISQIDVLLKYVYRGMEFPETGACAALLGFHKAVCRVRGTQFVCHYPNFSGTLRSSGFNLPSLYCLDCRAVSVLPEVNGFLSSCCDGQVLDARAPVRWANSSRFN